MTEPGRGGHELRWARGRNAFGVPPLALARGGSPGCETALLRSCPPHSARRGSFALRPRERDDGLGRSGRGRRWHDARRFQQAPPLLLHGAGHAHHQRLGDVQLITGRDDPARYLVTACYPAEDVDEHAAYLWVEQHHLEG